MARFSSQYADRLKAHDRTRLHYFEQSDCNCCEELNNYSDRNTRTKYDRRPYFCSRAGTQTQWLKCLVLAHVSECLVLAHVSANTTPGSCAMTGSAQPSRGRTSNAREST